MKKEKWTTADIPDQSGRTVIVTGSNSGIGFEAAKALAAKKAKVIMACRNLEKANEAAGKIRSEINYADVKVMKLDLSNLKSVKDFVLEFNEKNNQLHLLINNAGVMIPPYTKTIDGFELQFGTNHLGHFALTAQLFDLIKTTNNARIVNVASTAHKAGNINFNDLHWEKRKYNKVKAYGDSKIANLYFTYELQKKLNEAKLEIVVTAAHPGWTSTNLQRYMGVFNFLNILFSQKQEMGALPTLRAATENGLKGAEYFGPSGFMEMKGYPVIVKSNKLSQNEEIAKQLWKVSEKLTNEKFKL